MFNSLWNIISTLLFVSQLVVAMPYSADGKDLAVFWGQGSNQESLGTYCQRETFSIVMISFLNNWNATAASFNFGNACWGSTCSQIEEDIKTCQNLGIKVMLSLGGDSGKGTYGVTTDEEGKQAASVIHNMFNPNSNSSVTKPFGSAEIDGFDFDLENSRPNGLGAMVAELRSLWTSKTLLISASPQCVYPDSSVQSLLEDKNAKVDFAFVQFYNNPACGLVKPTGFKSSWETWKNFATGTKSGNSKMKLFVGLCTACNSEYIIDPEDVKSNTGAQRDDDIFGGFSLWEATSAIKKENNGLDYVSSLNYILNDKSLPTSNGKRDKFFDIPNASTTLTTKTIGSSNTPEVGDNEKRETALFHKT